MTRTEQIKAAIDNLITVHDEWEADPTAPAVPTDRFEAALKEASEVCEHGDTPEQCREVVTAMSRLYYEWERYENGLRTNDHRPQGSFWGAFRALLHARKGVTPFVPHRPEPVSVLLAQKVSDRQIALYIYGDGTDGPLCTGGRPDSNKIQQEAKKPGSVVPQDWIHPQDRERKRIYDEECRRRLEAVQSRENEGDGIDPASVEELLRQGQYPGVVARVKRVDISEVLKVAERLAREGVTISPPVNLASVRAPHEPQLTPEQDAALQPRSGGDAAGQTEDNDEEDQTEDVPGAGTDATMDELIVELSRRFPDDGAGDLVTRIRNELGENVTVQKVTAVLRKAKEKPEAAAV